MKVRLSRRAALVGAASLLAGPVVAQGSYPDRPIRVVVPAGAGGPTDVVTRILQPHLSRILGQLSAAGLIQVHGRKVEIPDVARLRDACRPGLDSGR